MDPTTAVLLDIAQRLHISPIAAAVWIPMIVIMANRAAKLIPDNATGPLKYLRLAAAIIGLKVSNNSGVPAVPLPDGTVIRRADPAALPDAEQPDPARNGSPEPELPLTPPVTDVFAKGAAAVANKDSTHEG